MAKKTTATVMTTTKESKRKQKKKKASVSATVSPSSTTATIQKRNRSNDDNDDDDDSPQAKETTTTTTTTTAKKGATVSSKSKRRSTKRRKKEEETSSSLPISSSSSSVTEFSLRGGGGTLALYTESSDKDQDKDVDVDIDVDIDVDKTPKKIIEELFDASARGVGQVIFLNNCRSGQILGLGLFLGDPYLAGLAALGTFTATTAATVAGLDKTSITDGLMGYNGCLVGCALAVFGPPSIIAATTATIVGASATPFVAASLKEAMGSVPQWTFAFNFVTLTSLLRTRPLLEPPSITDTETMLSEGADVVVSKGSTFADVVASPLTGVSQIFVVQSPLSGAIILGGIGSYSPMLAVHALGGSTMGTVVGAMSGAPLEELTMGLYGFNSALTSMAVGVFFVHSTPTVLLSACGAASTASLFYANSHYFRPIQQLIF